MISFHDFGVIAPLCRNSDVKRLKISKCPSVNSVLSPPAVLFWCSLISSQHVLQGPCLHRSQLCPHFSTCGTCVRVSNKGVLFELPTRLDYGWKIVDFKHGKEKERWRRSEGREEEEEEKMWRKWWSLIANGIPHPGLLEK